MTCTLAVEQEADDSEAADAGDYLVRRYSRQSLAEVGRHFGLHNYSTVSRAVERIKACSTQDQSIHDQLQELMAKINKGQKKTPLWVPAASVGMTVETMFWLIICCRMA